MKTATLSLPFTPPYDWAGIVEFLAARAIPGVEQVDGECYRRTIAQGETHGWVEVGPVLDLGRLVAKVHPGEAFDLARVVNKLRHLFDLDAEVGAIIAHLGRDSRLGAMVRARPGLRVPGAWDEFELVVRAILGQQVSIRGASTLAGRLAALWGKPLNMNPVGAIALTTVFPLSETLAQADVSAIGLPRARAGAISSVAKAFATNPSLLRSAGTSDETCRRLSRLPGIGPWTAQYIAMRAMRDPDAFPASDLGLLRAMSEDGRRPTPAELLKTAEAWRPWRAYAAMHLWKNVPNQA
ncbi:MAG: DNA-3-methyladenine glycosylase 2 family protein [Rhodospirillales bacterium]|nr:DNA-3-methyladenine glycosylase 2 family protein [Rhodospirillales bacterium]